MKTPEEFRQFVDNINKQLAKQRRDSAVALLDAYSETAFKNLNKASTPFFIIPKSEITKACKDLGYFKNIVEEHKFFCTENDVNFFIFWDKQDFERYS